jgi:hypothetical protein
MYYQYSDPKKEMIFGAFPRRDKIDFPLVMLTDTLLYYRPNIEGMFGAVRWDWGYQNVFVDWISRQTNENRKFLRQVFQGKLTTKTSFFKITF